MNKGFTINEFNMILEKDLQLRFNDWLHTINSHRGTEKFFLLGVVKSIELTLQKHYRSEINLLNKASVSIAFNESLIHEIQLDIAKARLQNLPEAETALQPGFFVTETSDIRFKEWIKNLTTPFSKPEIFFENEISICKKHLESREVTECNYYNKTLLAFLEWEYYMISSTKQLAKSFDSSQKVLFDAIEKVPYENIPSNSASANTKRIFKMEKINEIYNVLKDYFAEADHSTLKDLLKNGTANSVPITFLGQATQLTDCFKNLYEDGNYTAGVTKKELEEWIFINFKYTKAKKVRQFSLQYLNNLISTSTDSCKRPIVNVKGGQIKPV